MGMVLVGATPDIERKQRKAEYDQEYRAKNRERIRAYQRAYYKEHQARLIAKQHKYYEEHREEVLAACKAYREANHETIKERVRKYRQSERGKRARRVRDRRYEQSAKGRANARRGYTKRRQGVGAIVDFTADEWAAMLGKHDYRCAYCGEPFDLCREPTQDHIVPISKGGDHTKSNIVPACKSCNSRKNNRPVEQFLEELNASAAPR